MSWASRNPSGSEGFTRIFRRGELRIYLDDLQAKVDGLKALQAQTQAELDALLPSILDKAFKGEL